MGWFRDLLSPSTKSPSYGREIDTPAPVDWAGLEDRLVSLASSTTIHFAARHPSVSVYGLAFDCDSESGEIQINFNSRDEQRKRAEKTANNPNLAYGKTTAQLLTEQEWDIGGWKWPGVNLKLAEWRQQWRDVQPMMFNSVNVLLNNANYAGLETLRNNFTAMATRAAIRLQTFDAIADLAKDPDFRIVCIERQEGPEAGFARMAKLRGGGV